MYAYPNTTDYTPIGYIDWAVGIEPLLFPLLLFAIFIITFGAGLIATGGRPNKALIFSCFISAVFAMLMVAAQWMSMIYVGICIVGLAFSVLLNKLMESRD